MMKVVSQGVSRLFTLKPQESSLNVLPLRRIALVFNDLTSLPTSFTLISRLRYLNLRSNFFAIFPEVVSGVWTVLLLFKGPR